MAKSGVESARTVFSWAAAQPVAGQPPSFTETDQWWRCPQRTGSISFRS